MKYPKILQPNILDKFNLKADGHFFVQEKYDGSQFRFGIDETGKYWFGSKGVTYTDKRPPEKMFIKAVQKATEALDRLKENTVKAYFHSITFFAEYIRRPKHNTLTYDHVPENNLVLFDVYDYRKNPAGWLNPEDVTDYAKVLGIDHALTYVITSKFPPYTDIEKLLTEKSSLGGTQIEGVVIKNYDITLEINGEIRPLFYKYVRDDFKELNNAEWNSHPNKKSIESIVPEVLNKEAVFRKAVQHLEENGKAEGHMRDMQRLIPLVYEDLYEEYLPAIQEMLIKKFQKDIEREIVRGLPEYYKKYLYEKTERALNES